MGCPTRSTPLPHRTRSCRRGRRLLGDNRLVGQPQAWRTTITDSECRAYATATRSRVTPVRAPTRSRRVASLCSPTNRRSGTRQARAAGRYGMGRRETCRPEADRQTCGGCDYRGALTASLACDFAGSCVVDRVSLAAMTGRAGAVATSVASAVLSEPRGFELHALSSEVATWESCGCYRS
jgi:hypothetical protein